MHRQTDLPSSVHLVGLAIKFRELNLGRRGWISDGDVKLEVEFVLEKVVDVPALADPTSALCVGSGNTEPVVVLGLVHRGVGDECPVLFLEPLRPRRPISWPRLRCQERYLR